MDIIADKNVYMFTEGNMAFIISRNQGKQIKVHYDDPNRKIIENKDKSITIEDIVSAGWVLNHIVDKEDYEKIENALKEAISKTKFTAYEVR